VKILVAGANGQVGSELVKLGNLGLHDIIGLNRHDLDITSRENVNHHVLDYKPDLVINAAAYTAVDKAEKERDEAFIVNRDGALNLALACKMANISLIHLSTDYVFDGENQLPYNVDDPVAPLNVYGQSKLEGELSIINTFDKYIIIRTSWVFGMQGHNFVKTILRAASERNELSVVDDQFGAPTSAAGIAAALVSISGQIDSSASVPWGTYHFSGSPFTSWYGFAKKIVQIAFEYKLIDHEVTVLPIATNEYPAAVSRPANTCLSNDLIFEKFSIKPDDWESALRTMFKQEFHFLS